MSTLTITYLNDIGVVPRDTTFKSTKIQCRVFNSQFHRFQHLLNAGDTLMIKNPNMAMMGYGFNITEQEHHIVLQWDTIVRDQNCPKKSCFDVIGHIVSRRDLDASNSNQSKHNIKGTELRITLYGFQAHQLSDFLTKNTDVSCVIIIVEFVALNGWNDRVGVQSYYDSTKLLVNADIEEINEYRKKRGDSLAMCPPELNVLKQRKAAFLVEVTTYNVTNLPNLYSINKIVEDAGIISELESKVETLSISLAASSETDAKIGPSPTEIDADFTTGVVIGASYEATLFQIYLIFLHLTSSELLVRFFMVLLKLSGFGLKCP
ncbi:unnamed protein product [Lactuca virosa]|uniref:DUF223 domain-containing protein n=1 Tax=Lactuca virosa TaxID=75947 RepID=A0AAU9PX38_9ASTR|nr:unnamed protein product [Lactuca virosa]